MMLFGKEEKEEDKHNTFHTHYKRELEELKESHRQHAVQLEALEAKHKAQDEMHKLHMQKFDRLNEKIGELHEMFKEISDAKKSLDLEFSKVSNLVKTVDPQKLMKAVHAAEGKVSIVDGKLSLIMRQHEHMRKELDTYEHKLKVFKGEDELFAMQQKAIQDLNDARKISQSVNMHASKAENALIKIDERANKLEERFAEMASLKHDLERLKEQLEYLGRNSKAGYENGLQVNDQRFEEIEASMHELAVTVTESLSKMKERCNRISEEASEFVAQYSSGRSMRLSEKSLGTASAEVSSKKASGGKVKEKKGKAGGDKRTKASHNSSEYTSDSDKSDEKSEENDLQYSKHNTPENRERLKAYIQRLLGSSDEKAVEDNLCGKGWSRKLIREIVRETAA